ncbi:MAG: phosphoglucosamine mutase [Candidatus Bathyarchaeota archaeon]|nr:phosphoglucosamine mutase [Candidatus Bathyarchaeota archaeon]
MRKLFGTNGVRGILNKSISVETLVRLGYAIGTYFEGGRLLVGMDGRIGSPIAKEATVSGLLAAGCEVLDVGLAPTPVIQYDARFNEVDGCVIFTASHNPPEYIGVKVCGSDGVEIPREGEEKIESIFFEGSYKLAEWDMVGRVRNVTGSIERYIEAVIRHVDRHLIAKHRYRVVVDPGNGVSSLTIPHILKALGCEVYTINDHIDGRFPGRLPEPSEENLSGLIKAVKVFDADLGVAYDGDGDRAVFVDEEGVLHPGDRSLALIEDYVMEKKPGAILVTPVSTSQVVDDIAERRGGRVIRVKVGSVDVSWAMKKLNAELGGEENGGVFYGLHQPVRDGGITTVLILHILAVRDMKLSEALSMLPVYHIIKRRVQCRDEFKHKILSILEEKVKDIGRKVERIDGLKIWFDDREWMLIRPSGTEPIYRVVVEAQSYERAEKLAEEYTKLIVEIAGSLSG